MSNEEFQKRVTAFNDFVLTNATYGEVYDLIIENYEKFGFDEDEFNKIIQPRLKAMLSEEARRKRLVKKLPKIFD